LENQESIGKKCGKKENFEVRRLRDREENDGNNDIENNQKMLVSHNRILI
jgi:hypothetical protein